MGRIKRESEYETMAMKGILVLLAVVAATSAKFEFTEEWELWKKVH